MGNRKSKPAQPTPAEPVPTEPTAAQPTPEQREQNRVWLEALAACVREETGKQPHEEAAPAPEEQPHEEAAPAPEEAPAPQATSDADLERLVRTLLHRRPRARAPCCSAPTFEAARALVRLRAYGAEEPASKRVRWADTACA